MNSSHANISEELLARYLADTASDSERNDVEAWLAESEANARELASYRLIWDHAASMKKKFKVDADAAWNKMKGRMAAGKSPASSYQVSTREASTLRNHPFRKQKPLNSGRKRGNAGYR
jgi:transmembrane sensor